MRREAEELPHGATSLILAMAGRHAYLTSPHCCSCFGCSTIWATRFRIASSSDASSLARHLAPKGMHFLDLTELIVPFSYFVLRDEKVAGAGLGSLSIGTLSQRLPLISIPKITRPPTPHGSPIPSYPPSYPPRLPQQQIVRTTGDEGQSVTS